jgi:ATP-dependent Clp protease ATP-binding subunit ClpC
MPTLDLEFPVLVTTELRSGKRHFVVRPLFSGAPEGAARLFDRAMRKCVEDVRRQFRALKTERSNLDALLWYRFSPPIESRAFKMVILAGQKTLVGDVRAAWFEMAGRRVVCLPGFAHHLFVARDGADMESEVTRVVTHLWREELRGDDPPDPKTHLVGPHEFITAAATTLHVEGAGFAFEKDATEGLLATLFREGGDFNGAAELDKTSRDLNLLYPDDLLRAHGADGPVERVQAALFTAGAAPTVLLGPRGAGKTTIVHEAVARTLAAAPSAASDKIPRVWHLDPNRVIAGMAVVGQWENRLEAILADIRDRLKKRYSLDATDALFVDNAVALLRVGKSAQNALTIADILKPYLERRDIRFVCEATPEAWKLVQELDRGFADLFEVVRVPEPPLDEAVRIVSKTRARLERDFDCRFANDAVARLVDLERLYPQRRAMPGSVVDRLKQLAAKHREAKIDLAQVDDAFAGTTKLDRRIFDPSVRLDEKELGELVRSRLVGQDDAVRAIVDTIHTMKARLTPPEKPVASLLFIGPTGVGKTEAAKVLARALFADDEEGLARFDMNEYVDDGAVARLIGDHDRPEGLVTSRVRHRPFCVLLFDEIEKAHETVHDLLLQVLGEGRLTDSVGRTTDFANAVVIMTSNLGAGEAARSVGFAQSPESQAAAYRKAVQDFFRPEFVNRIDRIVSFQPLARDEVKRIARLQIERLLARDGFVRRATCLNVRERALDRIAERGFDASMGGRALKRAIERELTWMAAEKLVELPSNEPVVLEVYLRDGHLAPRVIGLPFVERGAEVLPFAPPTDEHLADFFERLLDAAQKLDAPKGAGRDVELMVYRDRVRDAKEKLMRAVDDPPPRGTRATFSFAMRRLGRVETNDLFAQLDIRDYLNGLYERASAQVEAVHAGAVERFIEVASLHAQRKAIVEGRRGSTCISIRPMVESGLKPVVRLVQHYVDFLRYQAGGDFDMSRAYYLVPGAGFADLLRGENGVHLFFQPYGSAIPVQVRVFAVAYGVTAEQVADRDRAAHDEWLAAFERGEAKSEDDPLRPGPVLRLYAMPGAGSPGSITDLRTGMIDRWDADAKTWFLWAYAGIPSAERLIL